MSASRKQSRDGTRRKSKVTSKRSRPKKSRWKRNLVILFGSTIGAMGVFVAAFMALLNSIPFRRVDIKNVQPTIVYAGDGSVFMKIQPPEAASHLTYAQIPRDLQNAIVSTEDHTFWTGSSIDIRSILRAAVYDLSTGSLSQGASTIEEQLAKILYLNDNKTISYKLKEMALGIQLDRYYTKQEILTMYLNNVFLGSNSVGAQQAAERYFGVSLSKGQTLTLAQAALLAGLPQAPTAYDPLLYPHAALLRRNEVLQNMAKYGYITQKKAQETEKLPLGATYHTITQSAWDEHPLFTNFLLDSAQRLGISRQSILHGGMKVYTTINPSVQNAVHQVFWNDAYPQDFPAGVNGKPVDGAAIFVDPKTGDVLGAAGSRQSDYYVGGLDRVYSTVHRAVPSSLCWNTAQPSPAATGMRILP